MNVVVPMLLVVSSVVLAAVLLVSRKQHLSFSVALTVSGAALALACAVPCWASWRSLMPEVLYCFATAGAALAEFLVFALCARRDGAAACCLPATAAALAVYVAAAVVQAAYLALGARSSGGAASLVLVSSVRLALVALAMLVLRWLCTSGRLAAGEKLARRLFVCVLVLIVIQLVLYCLGFFQRYAFVYRFGTFAEALSIALFAAGSSACAGLTDNEDASNGGARLRDFSLVALVVYLLLRGSYPLVAAAILCYGVAGSYAGGGRRLLALALVAVFSVCVAVVVGSPVMLARIRAWLVPGSDPYGYGWESTFNLRELVKSGAFGGGLEAFESSFVVDTGDVLPLVVRSFGALGVVALCLFSLVSLAAVLLLLGELEAPLWLRCYSACVAVILGLQLAEPALELVGLAPPMRVPFVFLASSPTGAFDLVLLATPFVLAVGPKPAK